MAETVGSERVNGQAIAGLEQSGCVLRGMWLFCLSVSRMVFAWHLRDMVTLGELLFLKQVAICGRLRLTPGLWGLWCQALWRVLQWTVPMSRYKPCLVHPRVRSSFMCTPEGMHGCNRRETGSWGGMQVGRLWSPCRSAVVG